MRPSVFCAAFGLAFAIHAQSGALSLTVRADRPGHAIPKTLYGIFTGWFLTPPVACFIAMCIYFAMHLEYVPK